MIERLITSHEACTLISVLAPIGRWQGGTLMSVPPTTHQTGQKPHALAIIADYTVQRAFPPRRLSLGKGKASTAKILFP